MTANMAKAPMDALAKTGQIVGGGIGQDGIVQVIPEGLHGIEFRGIGGQPFDAEPRTMRPHGALDKAATMSWKPVPEQDNGFAAMTRQGLQETHNMRRSDATRMNGEEPTQALANRGRQHRPDSGQAFPVERFSNHRGMPSRSPRGTNRRALRKAGFIQKDQPSLQAQGVFFTRGQRYRTHRAIAFSSRSLARRAGRCRLHPIWPSMRQTWGWECLTLQVFQMTAATRSRVHNSVEKPHAVAP